MPVSTPAASSSARGVPAGVVASVLEILRASPGAMRRRKILEALEHRGHRISLAGLNRALQAAREAGLTVESPDGVRAVPPTR